MDYTDIKQLMNKVEDYIQRSQEYLAKEEYAKLLDLDKQYGDLSYELQDVPAEKMQMFHGEMRRFDRQLKEVRDIMVRERNAIRAQINSMGNQNNAAKAYMKSQKNSPRDDE
jgi:hypothetical protein